MTKIIAVILNPDKTVAEEKEAITSEVDLSKLYVVEENELSKLEKYIPDASDLSYSYEVNEKDQSVNLRVDETQIDVSFVKEKIRTEINEKHKYLWECSVSHLYQFLELSDNVEKLIAYFDQLEGQKQVLEAELTTATTLTENLRVPVETWPALVEETFARAAITKADLEGPIKVPVDVKV